MQREDFSPLEEAEALAKLMERHKYKQEDLAKVIGKARTTVTELLSLNALPACRFRNNASTLLNGSFICDHLTMGETGHSR